MGFAWRSDPLKLSRDGRASVSPSVPSDRTPKGLLAWNLPARLFRGNARKAGSTSTRRAARKEDRRWTVACLRLYNAGFRLRTSSVGKRCFRYAKVAVAGGEPDPHSCPP